MSSESTTPSTNSHQERGNSCQYTGLSKPECHCQACLRDLVARFGPERRA